MPIDLALSDPSGWSPPDDPVMRLRALQPAVDAPLLQRWFTAPHAAFWGMQHCSVDDVRHFYEDLLVGGHATARIGECKGWPVFVVECYDPAQDVLGTHYTVQPGDLGMHFFVGPAEQPEHGFTRRVFRALMRFMFQRLGAARVVVEPDIRNHKVHVLNAAMGFEAARTVELPHKTALLSFCTRAQFERATGARIPSTLQEVSA
jgi:RimJ/RimL family protein N-acetyltransferase